MYKYISILCCLCGVFFSSCSNQESGKKEAVVSKETPKYLYKVLSLENWQLSEEKRALVLSDMDDDFIHLATEDQLDRIVSKFWADASTYVVVKVESKKLKGRLVLEKNPGGETKYYHLYNGSIPKDAVAESKTYAK